MVYKPAQRNFENIQHAEVRLSIDHKFNDIHDELSNCYYSKIPFKDYGILDKVTFDKLHGLIFHHQLVAFHAINQMRSPNKRINEDKYRYEKDENGFILTDKLNDSQDKIKQLKVEGIELKI